MTNLPVTQMVLYKHGVGFFVREGKVEGDHVTLTFRKEDINDVLKSLVVIDKSGGQVLGIEYESPSEKDKSTTIDLSKTGSQRELIQNLRGRNATLIMDDGEYAGRIIGIDEKKDTDVTIALLVNDNDVQFFLLEQLKGIKIQDDSSVTDLNRFLDASTRQDTHAPITIRLSEGEHDLAVYYIAPSPSWRVSYRFVAEDGKAHLQGWGLFDNPLEEDINDAAMQLIAGQPISFIYDLYASRIPERHTIQDEYRKAVKPQEYKAQYRRARSDKMSLQAAELEDADIPDWLMDSADVEVRDMAVASMMSVGDMKKSVQTNVKSAKKGEFFEYAVTAPVTVKRGESALVPIIGEELEYKKELLYNKAKLPDHPTAAIRFTNTSGLVFERGPITVVEDGDYRGEAIIPFTENDNDVYLPYAVELGVNITERSNPRQGQMVGINFRDGYMIRDVYAFTSLTYIIENTTEKDVIVTIEAPIQAKYECFDMPDPDVETATERRWNVTVPAQSRVDFDRNERIRQHRTEKIKHLQYQKIQKLFEDQWLDKAMFDRLSGMLEELDKIRQLNLEETQLSSQQKSVYAQQEQWRENLKSLQDSEIEANLRARLVNQLEASEDQLAQIRTRTEEIKAEIKEHERLVEETIDNLGE